MTAFIGAGTLVSAETGTTRRKVIDLHCHIFNGRDIPIEKFITRVLAEDWPSLKADKGLLETLNKFKIPQALASIIKEIIFRRAPTVGREVQKDAEIFKKRRRILDSNLAKSLKAVDDKQELEIVREVLEDLGRLKRGEDREYFFKHPHWAAQLPDLEAAISHLSGTSPASPLRAEALIDEKKRNETAKGIVSGFGSMKRLLGWGLLLTKPRHEIFKRYLATYAQGRYELLMITPATVDFSYWLGKERVERHKAQVEHMSRISSSFEDVPLHGFVGFDPLRQVFATAIDKRDWAPMKLVKEATENYGFVGVKLYPPMGFFPIGNRGKNFPEDVFPKESTDKKLGERLDAALLELYSYCSSNGVPIMTHSMNSQQANQDFGKRANPVYWQPIFDNHKFAGLKINFAHFGDFNKKPADMENSWEWSLGEMIRDKSDAGIFADLSYFDPAFRPSLKYTSADKMYLNALSKWFEKFDPNCEHVAFGSDWSMIWKDYGHENYISNMEECMKSIGCDEKMLDNFFYKNAVRFLGLRPGEKGRLRIEKWANMRNLGVNYLDAIG